MRRGFLVVLAALGAACEDRHFSFATLEFEPFSPAPHTGGADVAAAYGDAILTSKISRDGGATWNDIHPAIVPAGAVATGPGELIVDTTAFGLGRWDLATDLVTSISPPAAPLRWWARRGTRTIFVEYGGTAVARQTADGTWSYALLPVPPDADGPVPEIRGVASNDAAVVLVSGWGVYRSRDDGASWELVDPPGSAGPWSSVIALEDRRFLVFAANLVGHVLDPSGTPTGAVTAAFPPGGARIPCFGGVVVGARLTRDLGATWEPLFADRFDRLRVSSTVCNGDHLIAFVDEPAPWLVRLDAPGAVAVPYPHDAYPILAGPLARTAEGTFLAGHMAWRPGDPAWTIRPLPSSVHALADGTLLAPDGAGLFRSRDEGITWESIALAGPAPEADRYFADDEGTLWASHGTLAGADTYRARLWRSDDDGATWTQVHDRSATWDGETFTGSAPYLVAIGDDGAFVATSHRTGLHVSRDRGETWTDLPFPRDYRLSFVTRGGLAVTWDRSPTTYVWHLWHDYGLGEAFRQVTPTWNGDPIYFVPETPLWLDEDDHVLVLTGTPLTIWRSRAPLR